MFNVEDSGTQTGFLIGLLLISVSAVVILSIVIYSQNQKIKKLENPQYGFLGKPLAVILVSVLFIGTSISLYSNNQNQVRDVAVSDPGDVIDNSAFRIILDSQLINSNGNLYEFRFTPVIEGVEWGGTESNSLDITWEIFNQSVGLKRVNQNGVNINFQPKLTYKLTPGLNTITVRTNYLGQEYSESVEVFVR